MNNRKLMLIGGVLAGPLYILVGAAQIVTRQGFDITRHPLSFMTLGDLGWIQITNFIITGLLAFLAAIALRRLAQGERRLQWGALLVGLYGLCVMGGGIFLPDPSLGFPPGTPDTFPETFSGHAFLHFLCGMLAFLSLIAATFVYRKHFATHQQQPWAIFSALTGALFLFAIIAPPVSGNAPWASLVLYVAVALGWLWLSAISYRALKPA